MAKPSMMPKDKSRMKLRRHCGKKRTFTAKLVRRGSNKGKKMLGVRVQDARKMLFRDIRIQSRSRNYKHNELLCDHVWMENITHLFKGLNLISEPLIKFDAKVVNYFKYDKNSKRILSWKLDNIENIKFIELNGHLKREIYENGNIHMILEKEF